MKPIISFLILTASILSAQPVLPFERWADLRIAIDGEPAFVHSEEEFASLIRNHPHRKLQVQARGKTYTIDTFSPHTAFSDLAEMVYRISPDQMGTFSHLGPDDTIRGYAEDLAEKYSASPQQD